MAEYGNGREEGGGEGDPFMCRYLEFMFIKSESPLTGIDIDRLRVILWRICELGIVGPTGNGPLAPQSALPLPLPNPCPKLVFCEMAQQVS